MTSPEKLVLVVPDEREAPIEVHAASCMRLWEPGGTVYPMSLRPDTREEVERLIHDVLSSDALIHPCAGYDSAS